MTGWIRLHRKIRENGLWPTARRYSNLEAWLDLLLSANHKAKTIAVSFKSIRIDRGQFLTSQVKLANRWQWHRETVVKFMYHLKSQKMIDIETSHQTSSGYTLITIRNYDRYQGDEIEPTDIQTDSETYSETSNQHTAKPAQTIMIKNEKKENTSTDAAPNGSQSSSISKKRKQSAPADPRVKPFLIWYAEEYEKRLGEPYAVKWEKDGKLIKALPSAFDIPKLQDLADRFLNSQDPWVMEHGGFTIGVFVGQINRLASTANGNGQDGPPKIARVDETTNSYILQDGRQMDKPTYERRYGQSAKQ